jgi:hypothetical protein
MTISSLFAATMVAGAPAGHETTGEGAAAATEDAGSSDTSTKREGDVNVRPTRLHWGYRERRSSRAQSDVGGHATS